VLLLPCFSTIVQTDFPFQSLHKTSYLLINRVRRTAIKTTSSVYSSFSDASTTATHSSNDSAGQLLSTRRDVSSYGRGEPPNQLNQPWPGIRTRGTSNSLIKNSVPEGKSEGFGSRELSLIARVYIAGHFLCLTHELTQRRETMQPERSKGT
jgi:hypothetical protein